MAVLHETVRKRANAADLSVRERAPDRLTRRAAVGDRSRKEDVSGAAAVPPCRLDARNYGAGRARLQWPPGGVMRLTEVQAPLQRLPGGVMRVAKVQERRRVSGYVPA